MNAYRIDGGRLHPEGATCKKLSCRPVVVIDPEDREQVELVEAMFVAWYERAGHTLAGGDYQVGRADALQAALREFANPTPPKPDEPTGLGAVVRDRDGRLYTRYDRSDVQPWWWSSDNPDDPVVRRYAWDDIDVAEVLSEGVLP